MDYNLTPDWPKQPQLLQVFYPSTQLTHSTRSLPQDDLPRTWRHYWLFKFVLGLGGEGKRAEHWAGVVARWRWGRANRLVILRMTTTIINYIEWCPKRGRGCRSSMSPANLPPLPLNSQNGSPSQLIANQNCLWASCYATSANYVLQQSKIQFQIFGFFEKSQHDYKF